VLPRTHGVYNKAYNATVCHNNVYVVSIGRYSTSCQKSVENLLLNRKSEIHGVNVYKQIVSELTTFDMAQ